MLARFADPERGGFFSTSADHEELIARRKDLCDHPIPSGNSAAALGLLRLAALTGERALRRGGRRRLRASSPSPPTEHPDAFAHLLRAIDFRSARAGRWRWSATTSSELAAVVRAELPPPPRPRRRPRGRRAAAAPAGRTQLDGRPAAYVCENFACQLPVNDPSEQLGRAFSCW